MGFNSEKRFAEGICFMNMCTSPCLPGYASYLSTDYMGVKKAPNTMVIILSLGIFIAQTCTIEFMTGFTSNIFPWNRDSDKSERMQDLHIFLWSSIPMTFGASYIDQLTYQLKLANKLPPFFKHKDEAALMFSLFIPGGGLFYKGYSFAGWGYHITELSLVSYGIYNYNKDSGRYALYGAAALKLIELIHAYIAKTDYDYYNMEKDRSFNDVSVSLGFRQQRADDSVYTLGANLRF